MLMVEFTLIPPLSKVLEEFADTEHDICDVLCFMFDLFSATGPLPHTMDGMLERIKDIQYSSPLNAQVQFILPHKTYLMQ